MFSTTANSSNAKPPPQNFRSTHPKEPAEPPQTDMGPLPPNVYLAPDAPADKPAPNWLRMVCISDTHNTTDANNYPIPEADILIHTGDFTKMGTTRQIDQFVGWLKSLTHIPIKVVVAGNHEVILDKEFYEENWPRFHTVEERHEVALDKLMSAGHGIIYLNNESYTVDGAKILHKKHEKQKKGWMKKLMAAGRADADASAEVDPRQGWVEGYRIWASPYQPEYCEWAFNEFRGKLKDIWKHIPENTDILMTHGPPKFHGDIVAQDPEPHVGCMELLERLNEVRPLYHVFGHIHQGYGVSEIKWDGGTRSTVCINASTCTEYYRPLNQPVVVDLPPK